jgi:hypothetical protein
MSLREFRVYSSLLMSTSVGWPAGAFSEVELLASDVETLAAETHGGVPNSARKLTALARRPRLRG